MRTDENSDRAKVEHIEEEEMLLADAFKETDGIIDDSEQKKRDNDWHSFETV
jgi:hypothetical protein